MCWMDLFGDGLVPKLSMLILYAIVQFYGFTHVMRLSDCMYGCVGAIYAVIRSNVSKEGYFMCASEKLKVKQCQ